MDMFSNLLGQNNKDGSQPQNNFLDEEDLNPEFEASNFPSRCANRAKTANTGGNEVNCNKNIT